MRAVRGVCFPHAKGRTIKIFSHFQAQGNAHTICTSRKSEQKNKTMVGIIKGKAFGSHLEVIYGISQYPHHEYAYAQRSTDL